MMVCNLKDRTQAKIKLLATDQTAIKTLFRSESYFAQSRIYLFVAAKCKAKFPFLG